MEFASDGEDGGHNMDIVEVMGSPVENGVDNDEISQANDGAMNPLPQTIRVKPLWMQTTTQ